MAKLYKVFVLYGEAAGADGAGAPGAAMAPEAARSGAPASACAAGAAAPRWCATRQEAELILGGAGGGRANPGGRRKSELIEEVELDEVELRQAAASWLNRCEKMRQVALKREANKTAAQRSADMKKNWDKRRQKLL